MSMEMAAWSAMYHATHAEQDRRPFSAATLRRIGAFARPHTRPLAWFLALSVFTAALAPRLCGTDAGSVRLGGQDVRDLTFAMLRSKVALVTQDGHLLHESIRANLALAAPGASDEQIWQALEQARLGGLVAGLPQGWPRWWVSRVIASPGVSARG